MTLIRVRLETLMVINQERLKTKRFLKGEGLRNPKKLVSYKATGYIAF